VQVSSSSGAMDACQKSMQFPVPLAFAWRVIWPAWRLAWLRLTAPSFVRNPFWISSRRLERNGCRIDGGVLLMWRRTAMMLQLQEMTNREAAATIACFRRFVWMRRSCMLLLLDHLYR